MCQPTTNQQRGDRGEQEEEEERKAPQWCRLWSFVVLLVVDGATSACLTLPLIPQLWNVEGTSSDHFTLYGTLWDLAALAALRIIFAFFSLLCSYWSDKIRPDSPFSLYHRNGDKKTSEELDNEALEEPFCPWFKRYIARPSFSAEIISLLTGILAILKCLARMDVEIGGFSDKQPMHPVFWIALLLTVLFSLIQTLFLDSVSVIAGHCGRSRRERYGSGWIRRIGSHLTIPLLNASSHQQNTTLTQGTTTDDVETGPQSSSSPPSNQQQGNQPDNVRGTSDITGDSSYKAKWTDLLALCFPDLHFIACAFVFLLLAATAQIYVPKYTGNILDSISNEFSGRHDDSSNESIWDVPGFIPNVTKLVIASLLCGLFSGFRGSIFTLVGGRVNTRLRIMLMDSLLSQDIGFFDTTKTGDITSRLTGDTTLVGDQVTLNVNVFLRSLVQVIGVLIFMFIMSWQLSLLAFISVPVITILSKWYGQYVRRLTKLMQKKLADGNAISEAAMGSMPTVRAFDAAECELKEFSEFMEKYLQLNFRSAVAYVGYCSCVTSLPNLVTAVVLFYGGLLVRNGDMTSGQLVSFLLYLQSLSDAFSSIGYIFSSLTQAVGAADKVFELLNRKPKLTSPAVSNPPPPSTQQGYLGVAAVKTLQQKYSGESPEKCEGEISLEGVDLFYPARPQRQVLNNLSLSIPSGKVIALVGPSGSGKSSVMSLVQHLYEQSAGNVLIDGKKVHDLCPRWLSRQVSVVSQEPTLFARSIHRNIMYGLEGTEEEPTLDEVKEAARLANAHDFIEKLPFGYETDVGERGVQLSGGQKQRVAIARALVRKPKILLLDEATSALDAESEALVQEAIDDMLARGRGGSDTASSMTVLIVAHRLSTVRNADIIFVIQDGQVVEQGSHDELTKESNGAYSNLINRQMKAKAKLEKVG